MRVYYGSSYETELTATKAVDISSLNNILDTPSEITITIVDNDGDEYANLIGKEFYPILVTKEDGTTVLWRGQIKTVTSNPKSTSIQCRSIAWKLEQSKFVRNCALAVGRISETSSLPIGNGSTLTCETFDGDAFTWTADMWIGKGVQVDDSTGDIVDSWQIGDADTVNIEEEDLTESKSYSLDSTYMYAKDTNITWDGELDLYVGPFYGGSGDPIPVTATNIQIKIWARFKAKISTGVASNNGSFSIQINKAGTGWTELIKLHAYSPIGDKEFEWDFSESTNTPILNTSDTNYLIGLEALRDMRVIYAGFSNSITSYQEFRIDYFRVEVSYRSGTFDQMTDLIADNGVSTLISETIEFSTAGVQAGDQFTICPNVQEVLNSISAASGLAFNIDSSIDLTHMFISNEFISTCYVAFSTICKQFGLHWWEDYVLNSIYISKLEYFVDSEVSLTVADITHDISLMRYSNQVRSVSVYGNPIYLSEPVTKLASSPGLSSIDLVHINESINTKQTATSMCDALLTEYNEPQTSISVHLKNVNTDLRPGMMITLTLERPTIAETSYPIRQITLTQSQPTGYYDMMLSLGMGHTPPVQSFGEMLNVLQTTVYNINSSSQLQTRKSGGLLISHNALINILPNQNEQYHVSAADYTEIHEKSIYSETETNSAISSAISTHSSNASAHHTRYTDEEALAAAEGLLEDSISNGVINKAPTENAVYDALQGKEDAGTADGIMSTHEMTYDHSLLHDPVTTNAPINVNGQDIELLNNADPTPAQVTAIDVDDTLAADSDTVIPTQHAVKSYVDTAISGVGGHDAVTLDAAPNPLSLTGQLLQFKNDAGNKITTVETTWTDSDTKISSSKAMATKASALIATHASSASAHHNPFTIATPSPLYQDAPVGSQIIGIMNDKNAPITEIDTGSIDASETKVPCNNIVKNAIDGLYSAFAPIANGVSNGDSHDHNGGDGATIDHVNLNNKGTNTHSQIDSHLSSTSNPHSVTASQVGLGNVTNDAQMKRAANDYSGLTEKTTPHNNDLILIEDSEDSYAKKKVKKSNIGGSTTFSDIALARPTSNGYKGITDEYTASEDLAFGDICYLYSDSGTAKMKKAKSDSLTTMTCVAICVESGGISSGNSGTFLFWGFVYFSDWNFTIKDVVFVSNATAGLATATAPTTTGHFIQGIGVAINADTLFFNPDKFYAEVVE